MTLRTLVAAALLWLAAIPTRAGDGPVNVGERLTLASKVLGEDRPLLVYLPPGYADSQARYPLLVLLDGQETSSTRAA